MAILLLALAIPGAWLLLRPRPVPPEQTVTLAEIVRLEGRLVRRDATNQTFTGWITESHPDGTRKSRSQVKDGLLEGLSEGWHTNGLLQIREPYLAGVAHGVRVKWYANGATQSLATITHGKLHGPFLRWHEDGTLAEEVRMVSGQPDGLSRAYYPSGFVKAEARLKAGEVLEQRFWKDGEQPAASSELAARGVDQRRTP